MNSTGKMETIQKLLQDKSQQYFDKLEKDYAELKLRQQVENFKRINKKETIWDKLKSIFTKHRGRE